VVVVDASAGAEIVAKTARGERLAALIPPGSRRDIPDHFTVETAGVVRRWELSGKLTRDQAAAGLGRLVRWPGYRYPLTPLLEEAWTYRYNLVIADALYVVLAVRLNADLITGDRRLANAPNLPPGLNVVTLPSVV
jgi:predicted nucleic acid-binding protein